MEYYRTSKDRFNRFKDYPFEPHYARQQWAKIRHLKGGHFLQEDAGREFATVINQFIKNMLPEK